MKLISSVAGPGLYGNTEDRYWFEFSFAPN